MSKMDNSEVIKKCKSLETTLLSYNLRLKKNDDGSSTIIDNIGDSRKLSSENFNNYADGFNTIIDELNFLIDSTNEDPSKYNEKSLRKIQYVWRNIRNIRFKYKVLRKMLELSQENDNGLHEIKSIKEIKEK